MSRTVGVFAALALVGCVPRPRMCASTSECSAKSACVAGRCQLDTPAVKPAVDSARRIVARPVDLAYVSRGEASSGEAFLTLAPLGRAGGRLFLRFDVVVPANVVEAYVVLRRSHLVDDDPSPISLHATRIVEEWSGRSISWTRQPRLVETRLPSTLVDASGASLVRVDVRDLVRQWRRRDPRDQGIAIVAEGDTLTGMTFALGGSRVERSDGVALLEATLDVEPYLELYVR